MKRIRTFLIILIFVFLYGIYWHTVDTLPYSCNNGPYTEQQMPAAESTPLESFQAAATESPKANTAYIANKNTKKFHTPSCSAVFQMSEKNKINLECTYDEALNQGYIPCKLCLP